MVWRLKSSSVLLLAGWLVGACLGGQTGEPESDQVTCTHAAAWDQSVDGVSSAQLAFAYQGEHRVQLHWSNDPVTVSEPVTLTLGYREQSGTVNRCNGQLSVSVNFSLRADDGTIIESGQGSLSAAVGMLQPATLSGSGQQFLIAANLGQNAGEVLVSGTLKPRADAATADSADFSNNADGVAGAGGNR
ncbi:MAG TPA: hypothetical protein VGJ91_08785 [Polyangiaceae bacterium]|jgi:hypothetical protein